MKRSFKLKAIHRIAGIITLIAIIGFSFAACDDGGGTGGSNTTVVGVTGVTLNKSSLSLDVGDTETLTATVTPGNATNKAVSWSTSNAAVATVANGVVTAVAPGSATITVTTADGGKTAACSVTVTEDGTTGVPVTGVTLNKSSLSLTVGGTETLTATVAPSNATNKAVTWSTSNAAVATVANGVVTAVAAGSAVITVTTADGSKTAACSVTVTASGPKSIFTLTDIPSQYNGVYMIVSADDNKSFYGFTIANSLLPEIKDGKARAALYEDFRGSPPRFTGTKVIDVTVNFKYEWDANKASPSIVILRFSKVSFTNGSATVSAKNARWEILDGYTITPPTFPLE